MPSDKKTQANRRNAARSTGPKTPEGKAVASRNATRHGLSSSRAIVLPEENRQDFDGFRNRGSLGKTGSLHPRTASSPSPRPTRGARAARRR